MKKLFFLAATLCGAMALSAQTWNFSTQPGSMTNHGSSDAATMEVEASKKEVLRISAMTAAYSTDNYVTVSGFSGLQFSYKNSGGTTKKGFVFCPEAGYVQLEGGDCNVIIPDAKKDQILYVRYSAKGTTEITQDELINGKGTTSLDAVYAKNITAQNAVSSSATDVIVEAKYKVDANGMVTLKSKNGYRIFRISFDGPTGLTDATAAPAEVKKFVKDGKLFILKDGKEISVLGF